MLEDFKNFGDISPEHVQTWIRYGDADYAEVVEIMSGRDVGLADNQYEIRTGSIYFSPTHWNYALGICDVRIGPPEYWEVASSFNCYHGFDEDYNSQTVVQIGKKIDDLTLHGTRREDPDIVLHGNSSISKYLKENYLS